MESFSCWRMNYFGCQILIHTSMLCGRRWKESQTWNVAVIVQIMYTVDEDYRCGQKFLEVDPANASSGDCFG